MEVTQIKVSNHLDHKDQLPASPCYLLRPELDKGLRWVASAKPEWQLQDGRPAIEAIADAAGLTGTHMFRLRKAPSMPPGNKVIASLVKIGSKAHRVPRETAHARLFWFFDPDNANDVARLTAYLQPASDYEMARAA